MMGNQWTKPSDAVDAQDDQKIDSSAEELNQPPTPTDKSTDQLTQIASFSDEPISTASPLETFQEKLAQKMKDLERENNEWEKSLEAVTGIKRSDSPRIADALEQYPLDPPYVDYVKIISNWFKENILSAITLEIEPANVALEELIEQFKKQVQPLQEKLYAVEKSLEECKKSQAENDVVTNILDSADHSIYIPVYQGQICTYAIMMIKTQIAMLQAIKEHLDHCVGWENASEAILNLLLKSLNLGVVNFVLPTMDFSSAYKTFLNNEIVPEEAMLESFVAKEAGALQEAKSYVTPLDSAAKSALLDTAGKFTRKKPSGVIAAPTTQHRVPAHFTE